LGMRARDQAKRWRKRGRRGYQSESAPAERSDRRWCERLRDRDRPKGTGERMHSLWSIHDLAYLPWPAIQIEGINGRRVWPDVLKCLSDGRSWLLLVPKRMYHERPW